MPIRLPRSARIAAGFSAQEVAALEADAALDDLQRRRQQAHDRAGRDRLARAAFAHDAQDLPGLEGEGDVLDRVRALRSRRQRDGQVADVDRRLIAGAPVGD